MALHVLVVGAGVGGLCLAHGLRKSGVDVSVFERDPSADSRRQGYRIHINAAGHAALEECLPPDQFALYVATSTKPPLLPRAASYDHQFTLVRSMDEDGPDVDPKRAPTAVNRLTLRQIMLARLGDAVQFGRTLVHVDQDEDGVVAHFADGSTATGDVLVAADGINSVVRSQLVPDAAVVDTGLRGITGKALIHGEPGDSIPEELYNKFTGVIGPDFHALALGVYQARREPARAAADLAPDVALDPVSDYLMWITIAPREQFPIPEAELWEADPSMLHRLALKLIEGWHPELRRLLEQADEELTFPVSFRTARSVGAWAPSNVTLLGDAIHAMTPVGGCGANTALWDAALLSRLLARANRGELTTRATIEQYENAMREHGFAAVEEALVGAQRIGARVPSS